MQMSRNPFFQSVLMIALALVLAVVANGFASRQRRLVLPGYYPHALRVPPREPERVPPPVSALQASPVVETATGEPSGALPTATATQTAATAPGPAAATTVPADTATQSSAAPVAPAQSRAATVPAQAQPLARFTPHPDKAFVEINGDDASLLHSRGVLFLDARRTSVFEDGHIAGARPFSVWESDIDDKVNSLFAERSDPDSQNLPIVIYCSGGECEDSHMLAQKLWGVQFNNVYVYKDGFPDWQKRGGAVRKGGQQ